MLFADCETAAGGGGFQESRCARTYQCGRQVPTDCYPKARAENRIREGLCHAAVPVRGLTFE